MRDGRLLAHAKATRSGLSPPEQRLWYALCAGRFEGIKFRRQVVLGAHLVDFCSRSQMLVIELDGDTHAGRETLDEERTRTLERLGFRVLRFANVDVMGNLEGVLAIIGAAIQQQQPPLPNPLP